jgi:Ser/Thr protein kinase RdoA (MazF antagonist)
MLKKILQQYDIPIDSTIEVIANGLINKTYKITTPTNDAYILQKINADIFLNPNAIAENIKNISNYLQVHYPNYLFTSAIDLPNGRSVLQVDEEYFRLFPFVKNSVTHDVLTNTQQAFEAAAQFGKFTKLLSGFDVTTLQTTIPNFHNLQLRFTQFEISLQTGNKKRILESKNEIDFLLAKNNIVEKYNVLTQDENFKIRVTHHDTKISNVLFDKNEDALCVIDLDTVMPGYFMSDVGDMMRTYLCPVSEEETDVTKIMIRKDYYDAIINGYLSQMQDELTVEEKKHFHFAGECMMYMQGLRFLTDYINNDIYYGAAYEKHNYNRAKNQIVLLQKFSDFKRLYLKL